MTFKINNNRLISLVLIVCIVFLCFGLSAAPAEAVVTEVLLTGACASNPVVALAVAGTILVGAGLSFDTEETLESMAAALINNNPVINNFIGTLDVMQATSAGLFDFNLTQAVVDELGGWLTNLFTATEAGSAAGSVDVAGGLFLNGVDISPLLINDVVYEYDAYYFRQNVSSSSCFQVTSSSPFLNFEFPYLNGDNRFVKFTYADGVYSVRYNSSNYNTVQYSSDVLYLAIVPLSRSAYSPYSIVFGGSSGWFNDGYCDLSSCSSVAPVSATADSTYFPQSTDDTKKLVPGIPLTVPESLSNLVDMPVSGVRDVSTDIPQTDVSSGTITGDGTGTGIFEGIGNWILNIPGIGAIARTISSILDFLQSMFDVSQFSLNFEPLKVGLTSVFPFCIPFDFFNAVSMFSAAAADFSFDIDLETDYFTIDHTVDLTPFRVPFMFFRYIVVFWFGFILISRTRDFIKW